MTAPLLETRGLGRNFGALAAASDINFRLETGARHALIGPNGAGKTTFINLLSGALSSTEGQVLLKGEDVTGVSEAQRVKRGIARTFQINRLFRGLSVLENVFIAVAERVGAARDLVRPVGWRKDVSDEAMHLLETFRLQDEAGHLVRELPYGRQRLVEIAIALGLKPEVLLLDDSEPGRIQDGVEGAGVTRVVGVASRRHAPEVVAVVVLAEVLDEHADTIARLCRELDTAVDFHKRRLVGDGRFRRGRRRDVVVVVVLSDDDAAGRCHDQSFPALERCGEPRLPAPGRRGARLESRPGGRVP